MAQAFVDLYKHVKQVPKKKKKKNKSDKLIWELFGYISENETQYEKI